MFIFLGTGKSLKTGVGPNKSLNLEVCKHVKKKFFSKYSTPESHIIEMYSSFINLPDSTEALPVMLQGVYNF